MESLAPLPRSEPRVDRPQLELLLADEDPTVRSLVASLVKQAADAVFVLEAADGAEALQVGLQRRPHIALLDASLPMLGGVKVALMLRELEPDMRLALHTAEPSRQRRRASNHRLPVFDKLRPERAVAWVEQQARAGAELPWSATSVSFSPKLRLECSVCGYGIARSAPPERCPMCQRKGTWVHSRWQPFSRVMRDDLEPASERAAPHLRRLQQPRVAHSSTTDPRVGLEWA